MTKGSKGGRYARFLALAVAMVVALGLVGYLPTRRLAGEDAIPAMVAGCAIGLLAAGLAGVLLVAVDVETPTARMQRAFLAMFVRLVVAIVLGVAVALSGELARMPLLFWMATSYVVLLPLEVILAIAAE